MQAQVGIGIAHVGRLDQETFNLVDRPLVVIAGDQSRVGKVRQVELVASASQGDENQQDGDWQWRAGVAHQGD